MVTLCDWRGWVSVSTGLVARLCVPGAAGWGGFSLAELRVGRVRLLVEEGVLKSPFVPGASRVFVPCSAACCQHLRGCR